MFSMPPLVAIIGIPLLIIGVWGLVVFLLIRTFVLGRAFSKLISKGEIPNNIRLRAQKSLERYVAYSISLSELLANVGVTKVTKTYYKGAGGNTAVVEFFPLKSWNPSFDYKDSFFKCYSFARIKSINIFDYNFISQYAVIKTHNHTLESFCSSGEMRLVQDGNSIGYFDFRTNEVRDASNKIIGNFIVPKTTALSSIGPNSIEAATFSQTFSLMSEVFLNGRKAAKIILQTSTDEEIEMSELGNQDMDVHMFQELNLNSDEERSIIFAFGVSFYALLENMRSNSDVQHQL